MRLNLPELIFAVTNHCNHSCKMCYYHDALDRDMEELEANEIERISLSLGDIKQLLISGGEPFLREDLAQICEIFWRNNHLRHLFIPTNGSVQEKILSGILRITEQLQNVSLSIMLSLEGLEKQHDDIHDAQGAFQQVVETVKELNLLRFHLLKQRKQMFALHLNTVVTAINIDAVLPLMKFVKQKLWVDLHTFSPMRGSGRDTDHTPPSGDKFEQLVKQAQPYFLHYLSQKYIGQLNPQKALNILNRRYQIWINVLNGGSLPVPCSAGQSIGVLEPNGDVRLCEMKPLVGNVRKNDYDFGKVWWGKKADEMRMSITNCSCTHACFLNASSRFQLASHCPPTNSPPHVSAS
ncbi:radical SAM/SPASM domain-containing protein [candidate division CSSED10-310 bacterium]|uniref:Radical SAM/SPASM domain-containing protein n=1 Tax=candidate division CSSED10-310 bacterium TaxID=2855610 RepID=A0ABV6Z0U1_UNCC1